MVFPVENCFVWVKTTILFHFLWSHRHSSDHSYTREIVRNSITSGLIYQDQEGKKYSQNTNQLVLGNLNYGLNLNTI